MASSSFYNTENPTPAEIETAQSLLDQANTVSQAVVDAGNTASTAATNAANSATSASTSATSATGSATTATTKASEASTSATNAASSASSASTSATNAASSATTATTKATEAASSATSAASSASSASTSATNAASSASSAATSASNAASTLASALVKTNNLSDLSNAVTARSNLGLGTVAIESTVPVAKGGTGLTSLTAGYIPFGAGTSAFGNSSNLFWDSVNGYLGIGLSGAAYYLIDAYKSTNAAVGYRINNDNTGSSASAQALLQSNAGQLSLIQGSATNNGGYSLVMSNTSGDFVFRKNNAAGNIIFQTGGSSERLRIDSSGNVGIGTSAPYSFLTVSAASSTTNQITGYSGSTFIYGMGRKDNGVILDSYDYVAFFTNSASGPRTGSERMRIDSAGNVGIGTSSPSQKLNVVGAALLSGASSNFAQTGLQADYASGSSSGRISAYVSTGSNLTFWTNPNGGVNAERLRIDSTGNVGIGTSSPSDRLHVQKNADLLGIFESTAGSSQFRLSANTQANAAWNAVTSMYGSTESWYIGGRGAQNTITFATGGSERLRIDSDGRVGIGTTPTAGYSLAIARNITGAASSGNIQLTGTIQSDVTTAYFGILSSPNTAAAAFTLPDLRYFQASQGSFGAGSSVTSQYGFHVNGTLTGATNNYGFYSNIASGTGRWNFYANGTADNYFAGNVGIGTSSPSQKLHVSGNSIVTGSGWFGQTTALQLNHYTNASPLQLSVTSAAGFQLGTFSNDSFGPTIFLAKSKGTTVGSNAAVVSGDGLGTFFFNGADGTGYVRGAQIAAFCDGTVTTGSMPGSLVFYTTPSGSGSPTRRITLDSAGNVGIGGTSFGSGAVVMFLANATTSPTTNPTGGGVLYVEAGALKYRGSSGTVTTIAAA